MCCRNLLRLTKNIAHGVSQILESLEKLYWNVSVYLVFVADLAVWSIKIKSIPEARNDHIFSVGFATKELLYVI